MGLLGVQPEGYSSVNFIAYLDHCDKEKQEFSVTKPTVTLIWVRMEN